MIHRDKKVHAAVRSVWVSSLNVIGGEGKKNKKKPQQSADVLG